MIGMTTRSLPFVLLALSACTPWLRDADFYASELEERLDARGETIAACYDRQLEQDPQAAGELVVHFEIAAKTGRFEAIAVDAARSSVPAPLAACVTDDLATLTMDPPDARRAAVTFAWNFVRGPAKAPPANPFAEAEIALLGCYAEHLANVDRTATGNLVFDYAFDRTSGKLSKLEVAAESSAPAELVACAKPSFEAASLPPDDLDDRNATGRRSYPLRFTPYVAPAEPTPAEPPPAEPPPTEPAG
jgi:hypothetical protein